MSDTYSEPLRDLARLVERVAQRDGVTVDTVILQLVTHINQALEQEDAANG